MSALKRRSITRYIDEVFVVLQEDNKSEEIRGARTLVNLKAYGIRPAPQFCIELERNKAVNTNQLFKKLL